MAVRQAQADICIEANTIRVTGEMTFDTVMRLAKRAEQLMSPTIKSDIVIDLSHVRHADSAGLALLCDWKRQFGTVCFKQIPQQLHNIMTLSGLDSVLFSQQINQI